MSDIEFKPGCVVLPGLIVCGPGGIQVREIGECIGLCAKPDARLVVNHPNSPWYGPDVSCECGDQFQPSESWLVPRPFQRGWRKKAQARFEERWESALPLGTKPVRDESEEGGGYLSGVVLPDGTEVAR